MGSFWNRQTVPKTWILSYHITLLFWEEASGKREKSDDTWMVEESVCISPAQGLGCVCLTSPVTLGQIIKSFWTSAFSQSEMGKCRLSQGFMRIPILCVPLFPSPPPFFPTGVCWVSITCQISDKPWNCSLNGGGWRGVLSAGAKWLSLGQSSQGTKLQAWMDQWSSEEPRALQGTEHSIPGSEVHVPLLVYISLTLLFLYPFWFIFGCTGS